MTRASASGRLGFLFIALSAVLFGSLGVATKGIFQVAKTNALSVTLLRAAIALPALALMCALVQGTRMFRIAASDLRLMMSAHFAAVVPNLRIMEFDPETVAWQDDLVTRPPRIEEGHLLLPTGPGWGTEVDEAAVRAHPPRTA